ncbi:MAG: hypothetical protein OEV64_10785 [Desulfobulbaceae bacterium]|nr:hypothetical protein [Desulfobulbaceae bacterium]
MKINYAKIDAAVKRLAAARHELRKVSNLRMGMISGMPSIDDENAEFESALADLKILVQAAIDGNSRLSVLLGHLDGELVTTEMVKNEIQEREWARENK